MNCQLMSSSPCLSLVCFLLVILLKVQSSSSDPYLESLSCRPQFECGNITASYPFWGVPWSWSEPACGHPDFWLYCEGDHHDLTTMMINHVKYDVLDINPTAQTLKIAILMSQTLQEVCPKFASTTFNSEHFYDSGPTENEDVTLNYNCLPYTFDNPKPNCQINGVKCKDGFVEADDAKHEQEGCNTNVSVPVPKSLLWTTTANWSDWKNVLQKGFELKWKKLGGVACEDCTSSNGSCGFDHETICYCPHIPNSSFSHGPCPVFAAKKRPKPGLVIGVAIGGVVRTAAAVLGIIIIINILIGASRRKHTLDKFEVFQNKKAKNDRIVDAFVRNFESFAPKRYSYSDVMRMTKSFSNKLGQGGYGDVYRGTLLDGSLVAVKFLKESKGNGEEFMNEIASISRTSHVNIVTLLGFCYERKKQALIYEFMPNGSLDKFIHDEEPSSTNRNLQWKTMYQIVVGIARGLEYLHQGCNTRIVHFDIKPHNILLDEDFCPKISDFGLAKLCKQKESIISMLGARGTAGYIAPEVFCRTFGEVSYKSDIYSFGMMILEMVGGRKNVDAIVSHTSEIYFPNWIYKRLEPGKDFEFHGVVTEEEKEMAKKMIVVSMWCIQTIPSDRPSIGKVLEMLEGSLESLQVPPKPSLSVPARPLKHSILLSSFSTSTSSYKPTSQEEEVCMLSDK